MKNIGVAKDTPLQVKVKNYMRKYCCKECMEQHKGQSCIYSANSDEYMCEKVPLPLKRLLDSEE